MDRRYIVTKGNETFYEGEHIWAEAGGVVMCREARGWVDMNDSPDALNGIEVKTDIEYYRAMANDKKTQAELAERLLEKMLNA